MTKETEKDFEIVKVKNSLKQKVGTGIILEDCITNANNAIQKLASGYQEKAKQEILEFKSLISKQNLLKSPFPKNDFQRCLTIAHNLKGEAKTYGYNLVTDVAKSLSQYLEKTNTSIINLKILEAHVDALLGVLISEMKGDNLKIAEAIILNLNTLIEKNVN
jgi:chemotaxis protein histidine kinase CheA